MRAGRWTPMEIALVLAIVAALAAMMYAFRTVARARIAQEQSNQRTCMANLHQIGIALKLYIEDHKIADWQAEIDSYPGISDMPRREMLVARWGFPLPDGLFTMWRGGYVARDRLNCAHGTRTFTDYVYHDLRSIYYQLPPGVAVSRSMSAMVSVHTWEDPLWVLKQRRGDYPIVRDNLHRRGRDKGVLLILRLDGRVERKAPRPQPRPAPGQPLLSYELAD